MRQIVLPLTAAVLAGLAVFAAHPALAQEARVEVRTGAGWTDGNSAHADIGAAAGYDINTGGGTFIGAEESVDKLIDSNQKVRFATTGRIGMHVSPNDKLYATGGYAYGVGPDAPTVGAGWEHGFGNKMYGKVEYKKYFNEDGYRNSNATLVGVGMHF